MAQTKIKGVIMPVDATAFLVRIKPQPRVNGDFFSFRKFIFKQDGFSEKLLDFSPYQPGDKIYVKEPWSKLDASHYIDRWYVYKSEMDKESERIRQEYIRAGYPYQWRSAYHMPLSAARHFKEVVKVEAVRCRDLSLRRWIDLGFDLESQKNDAEISYIISRFGQTSWDNNEYFFLVTVKTAEK